MKNKGLWILLGFVLIVLGVTSLALQLVGVRWAFLEFLELGGRLLAFVVKILMVIGGIVMVVLANTDWERERRESGKR
jgi:uncharacterized membrane protein